MDKVPSILMLSWNRIEYFRRTIDHLLADPSDFRLYMWDNGSQDGVADLIRDLDDPRIEYRFHSPDNVGQAKPWHWFLEHCKGDIAGKLDDDILGEARWMTRFAEMLVAEPRFGMLGAWVYQPEEWVEERALHKMRTIGGYPIFEHPWVPGGICLGRKSTLIRFSPTDSDRWGVPIDHFGMYRNGLVNGYPLPISFAHHLDDPRSPHCRMNRPGGWDQFAAYSARIRAFNGPEDYARWIAADARMTLDMPVADLVRQANPGVARRLYDRTRRLLSRFVNRAVGDGARR